MTDELKLIIELTSESAARKAADCAAKKVMDMVREIVPKDIELAINDHKENCVGVKSVSMNTKVVAIVGAACAIVSPVLLLGVQWVFSKL